MAFLDSLESKMSGLGGNISTKTKVLGIENDIRGLERQRKDQLLLLGDEYYKRLSETGEEPGSLAERVQAIQNLEAQIAEKRNQIASVEAENQRQQEEREARLQAERERMEELRRQRQAAMAAAGTAGAAGAASFASDAAATAPCPHCGAIIDRDSSFCSACGLKIEWPSPEEAAEESTPAMKNCVSCGREINAEALFCTYCGSKQDVAGGSAEAEPAKEEMTDPEAVDFRAEEPEEAEETVAETVAEMTGDTAEEAAEALAEQAAEYAEDK